MKKQEVLTVEIASRRLGATIAGCELVAFVCLTLVFAGCKKPAPAPPEKTLVRTTEVESMENVIGAIHARATQQTLVTSTSAPETAIHSQA
ncbi:MAG: hypothetical protein WBX20_10965 [Terrimicrobiaceae bacterium]